MAKAIHSMIRVQNESDSIDFYKSAFNLEVADRIQFDDFTLIYLRNPEADFELELTINHDQTESYELGNGYGHIAFVVDDLAAEHARFESEGLKPRKIVEFEYDGKPMAKFFFVTDPDGYQIEVLQKFGRYK